MKTRRLLALVLATALAMMCLSGCSSNGESSSDTKDAFILGGSGPLTGNAAAYGTAVKAAAEIAVEEINAQGKVKFTLVFEDDEADSEKAVTAYNNLIDKGMQLSLATVTSGSGQAVSASYQQDNIFGLTPSASSVSVIYKNAEKQTDPYGNIFQMCFTDPNQGTASAEYLSEHPDMGSKIGVIYRNDDAYSTGLYTNFMAEASKLGLEIVYEGGFTKDTTDYSPYVSGCQEAGADIVFLPIYYEPAAQILIQANSASYKPNFVGCDGMDGILTLNGFDTSLAEGLYMLTPFAADAQDDLTKNFVAKYKEKTGETPNQFAADAYDCVYALAQALENSDVTPSSSTDDITAALIEQFTTMSFTGLTGTNMTWSKTGEVSKMPKAVQIQNGVYVSMED